MTARQDNSSATSGGDLSQRVSNQGQPEASSFDYTQFRPDGVTLSLEALEELQPSQYDLLHLLLVVLENDQDILGKQQMMRAIKIYSSERTLEAGKREGCPVPDMSAATAGADKLIGHLDFIMASSVDTQQVLLDNLISRVRFAGRRIF